MKKILSFLFIITILISSCIGDECTFRTCSPPDFDRINALVFNFDLNTTFTEDDVKDAHIIRYEKGENFVQALATHYFTDQFATSDYLMVLSDPAPFSNGGTVNINSYENYDYIIKPNASHPGYKITNIEVKGEYQDCNCKYENTEKTFELDGLEMDRTNSMLQITLN